MSHDACEAITEPTELLHRQVHPTFIQDGRVTSQAFRPTPKDEGKLSVDQGSKVSAREAWLLHTRQRGLKSAGVWSVQVGQCTEVNLRACSDPLDDDPAHAFIDFRGASETRIRSSSKKLKVRALQRGCSFEPGPEDAPAGQSLREV